MRIAKRGEMVVALLRQIQFQAAGHDMRSQDATGGTPAYCMHEGRQGVSQRAKKPQMS